MDWRKLLCDERLERPNVERQPGRDLFQQDIDRIVFSHAFRRLAHKTQVHPLSENDHVHTRLTHSIEVSSVGRSLGTLVGTAISRKLRRSSLSPDAFGYVVQAACLAHDIGNPPFGHGGEEAICSWFSASENAKRLFDGSLTPVQRNDLTHFEGNAQGFRILTQLENYKWSGGLQLTYAVLGTFSKYPTSSLSVSTSKGPIGTAKVGFFDSERPYFAKVAQKVGLMTRAGFSAAWCRHPLAFLVEAADDICYAIIDIEDGYDLGYLTFKEARDILAPIAGKRANLRPKMAANDIIRKLRAVAIGELTGAVAEAFLGNEKSLLAGSFSDELLACTKYKSHIEKAKDVGRKKIYWSERKTKIEIAGTEIIGGLLNFFVAVVLDLERASWKIDRLTGNSQKLSRLMPDHLERARCRYDGLLCVTDFISSMTDRYALDLYRKLKGISV